MKMHIDKLYIYIIKCKKICKMHKNNSEEEIKIRTAERATCGS